ncbi:MAG TPA: alpha/beta hydrolase [Longimicrobiales bacterium]|nr:alpha/beta hydrolase [Longimicrobiales bacterium]
MWQPSWTWTVALATLAGACADAQEQTGGTAMLGEIEDHYVDSDGVRIHYVSAGEGPLVVFIHGFPDFWYSWRHQMAGLRDRFRVVAMDQRGYNLSDSPDGVENYDMRLLVSDVAAVIRDAGAERGTIVGHDWGGAVAWQFAFALPEMTERLVILNLPHPAGMTRELATNPEQRANSDYARRFREGSPSEPDILFGGPMTPETLARWVRDPEARARYVEAFARSDFDAMLAYYKRNYPALPPEGAEMPRLSFPRLAIPVLIFHGLQDTALHADGLNNTWDWIDADLTIVTAPNAGHFVQQDAAELVTSTLRWWLLARS